MLCPRCGLESLEPSEYESQSIHLCSQCWGAWMTLDQLNAIVADKSYDFSSAERRTIKRVVAAEGDRDRTGSEHTEAACPVCSATMKRRSFTESSPIVIDECPEHGVWLDTGELKELQVLHE